MGINIFTDTQDTLCPAGPFLQVAMWPVRCYTCASCLDVRYADMSEDEQRTFLESRPMCCRRMYLSHPAESTMIRTSSDPVTYREAVHQCGLMNPQQAMQMRRQLLTQLSVNAVDQVTLTTNTSAMSDEELIQRLYLIPFDDDEMKGSLHLKAEGPCHLYGRDLKTDQGTSPTAEPMAYIGRLEVGQTIDLRVTLKLGDGSQHTKWAPVTNAYFELADSGTTWYIKTAGTDPQKWIRKVLPPSPMVEEY